MQVGYKLATEGHDPVELVRQAVAAEQAGFDYVEASDHFHPWLDAQGHGSNTWNLLSFIAAKTERIGIATGVTCPSYRYHPAVIAQAAATLQILSGGRFVFGVGSGERLNEHIIGTNVFDGIKRRHERFVEALEIIRLLWQGGYRSYEGKHLQLEDARVFDLPETLPPMIVAASGPRSAKIAADLGDGMFNIEPKKSVVDSWKQQGGTGDTWCEVPLAWATTEDEAIDAVMEKARFSVLGGWKVLAELPNPVNFDAASSNTTRDQLREAFACGPDVNRHLEVIQQFVDAGFENIVLQVNGPDPDGFLDFYTSELEQPLRAMKPTGPVAKVVDAVKAAM